MFRAKETAGSHRVRRSSWLKSVAGVESVVVSVVGEQRFVILVPWMYSTPPGDPPGAAAPPIVAWVIGNANVVRRRSHGIGLVCESL
jgi:hypothetical protein